MIKVVAFDMEGVLIKDTALAIEKRFWSNRIPAEARQRYIKAFHYVDTGVKGEGFLIDTIHEILAPHWSKAKVRQESHNTKLIPPWNLVKQLENNYLIAIWTNNYRNAPSIYARLLGVSFAKYKVINSALLGVKKPDPAFYRAALKKLGVRPDEVLFIDDRISNVKGARKMGIKTFHYNRNMAQLKAFLKKHGIKGV